MKELQEKHSKLLVTLVDHHVLPPKDKFLEGNIVSIFDHRPIDKDFNKTESIKQIVIQEVGSCTSLITQEILKYNEKLLSEKIAILVYCKCFKSNTYKTYFIRCRYNSFRYNCFKKRTWPCKKIRYRSCGEA